MVSTIALAACRIPFISLPHKRFLTALTSGIPGRTSMTRVWMTVGSLSVIPIFPKMKVRVVAVNMTKALVNILSTPGMASAMSM